MEVLARDPGDSFFPPLGLRTIIHLFPSSSFFGGFFVRMLSGFLALGGAGLLLLRLLLLSLRVGTGALARNDGFLCVI
jgi:hypothetical protein